MTTTKQEYQQKIVNSIVFKTKITDKKTIQSMNNIALEDVMFYYIDKMDNPTSLQECHNQFSWIRKYAMPLIKKKGEHVSYLREIQEKYKEFIKIAEETNISDFSPEQYDLYELYLKTIKQYEIIVKMFEDMIIRCSFKIEDICEFYDKHNLSFHDFCQLINMNPIVAKQNIRDEDDDEKEHRHYKYLFGGIENDRSDDGWKQNKSNDMPLFHLVHKNFILMLNRNKDLKEKVNNKIMDMGFAEHAMVMKEDAEGNKTLEKYYPPLRVVE